MGYYLLSSIFSIFSNNTCRLVSMFKDVQLYIVLYIQNIGADYLQYMSGGRTMYVCIISGIE